MFRNIFGGKEEGDKKKGQEDAGATVGDIFYDEAVKAAQRTSQQSPAPFPAIDSDVFLNEDTAFPQQQRQQPQQPQQPHQQQPPQVNQNQQQQQYQQQGPAVFIPQGYQTPAQLRAKYDRMKENRNTIMKRLRAASESDASKNPYAVQGQNGQVNFDQNRHNRDQLDYTALDSDMREVWSQITEAERSSGEVTEQIRKAANQYFQQQFAGRKASQQLIEATGSLFGKHVQQLIRSGFLLDPNNLTSHVLDSHFRNVFYAALGEASSQVGSGLGVPGTGRAAGQTDSDPEQQKDDPRADWPEESKRLWAAFERSQGMKPKTIAEQARLDKQREQGQQGQQNGGNQ